MAFNFNWSPLTADAEFYSKAQEMLTAALNKSTKPPIIVDDILVNELNLGSVPPDLEILEIGDLAEDRFRGIFKMCYSGDAFLTLKTRVQVCFTFLFGLDSLVMAGEGAPGILEMCMICGDCVLGMSRLGYGVCCDGWYNGMLIYQQYRQTHSTPTSSPNPPLPPLSR